MGEKQGREEEMTQFEAIRRADQRMKNDIPMETKKRWLDGLQTAVSRERRDDLPVPVDVAEAYLVMRYALEADDLNRYNTWAEIFNLRVRGFIARGK
jgi:hypothetical protein